MWCFRGFAVASSIRSVFCLKLLSAAGSAPPSIVHRSRLFYSHCSAREGAMAAADSEKEALLSPLRKSVQEQVIRMNRAIVLYINNDQ